MIFTSGNIMLIGGVLIFASILISRTGFRFGFPALLLFLLTGMLFGSDSLGLQFNSVSDAQFIGMVALSIILFTGGLDTKLKDIRPVMKQGILLSTVGVLLTTLLTGSFIYFLSFHTNTNIQMPWPACLLLAATMSSTDSASVFNLLRTQKINLKENIRPILELESGSNDPMAYMLTITLIQVVSCGSDLNFETIGLNLLIQLFVGGILGYGFGYVTVKLINHIRLPNASLYPIFLLSLVFIAFSLTDTLKGNGYLAVYIMGVFVGNKQLKFRKDINAFMNELTWLFQIAMFLSLGLLVNPHEMLDVAIVAVLIAVFMMIVARPVTVFVCLLPFRQMTNRARLFISWVGLRGAVPIIFATYPVVAGIPGSQQIFNIVFFITLLSLIFQGMTIAKVARLLKLDLPEEKEVDDFGVELPEDINSQLMDETLTADMLANGNRLSDMNIPKRTLVMLVKRGNEYIIPNGQMELQEGDQLLYISEKEKR